MNGELPLHPSDEERLAAAMARELESMTITTTVPPGEGFADRVMLAIADEPLPQPVRAFGLALLAGHFRAAASAVGDAWRTISSTPAPLLVRVQSLALVLVVLFASLTAAGGATVGAMGLLGNGPTTPAPSEPPPSVPVVRPSPSPSPDAQAEDTPSASPEESSSADPTETPEATETQDAQETERPTTRPRTAEPTDDHGGDGSGSGSGSGSDGGDQTPSPTETPTDHSGGDG